MKPWALFALIPVVAIPGCPDSGAPARYDAHVDTSPDGAPETEVSVPGLCDKCSNDSECDRGSCLTFGGGHYCVPSCEDDTSCPPFFRCLPVSGEALRYCIPLTKTCTCTFLNAGEAVACERSNPFGACKGQSVCDPKTGWACTAPVPAAETCNAADDDCDGVADEDFVIAGQYVHDEHCGACGASCLIGFENGIGRCSVETGIPTCALSSCDTGYLPLDGKCVPSTGKLCTPCVKDADCGGGRCRVLPTEGGICASSCIDLPCPNGYVCQPADAIPEAWCMPATGSCTCGPGTIGLTRTCSLVNAAGTCFGLETCTALGFAGCTAKAPSTEICNGLDEDCDGFTDEDLAATECTSTVTGLGACKGMQKCSGVKGWVCDAPMPAPETCNYQDDDCDGFADDGFKDPSNGVYFLDTDCGACGNDCAEHEARPNATYHCSVVTKEAACRMVCKEGFFDVNRLEDDGCECEFLDPTDPPNGIDENCDGVDGEPDKAVFVAEYGKDANPGTLDKPFRSIQKGLEAAAAKGLPYVYVGAGSYTGAVSLRNGIEIYGGFNQGFSVCKPESFESRISMAACQADNAGTVNAIGLGTERTVLSGFTVEGPDCIAAGQSSYAVYIRDCEGQLVILNNRILGGRGGPGEAGTDGGKGTDGLAGTDGKPAMDTGMPACLQKLAPAGGLGGKSSCDGVPVNGGDGGTAACPDYDEYGGPDSCGSSGFQTPEEFEYGKSGLPSGLGGAGGSAGMDSLISTHFSDPITGECSTPAWACAACQLSGAATDGLRGDNGKAGPAGAGGQGCSDSLGAVSGGYWHGQLGKAGTQGSAGGGGGGGGAGGGVETDPGCSNGPYMALGFSDFGGTGGGGGSAGCGGAGATGGEAGGGSFAVFMTFGKPPVGIPGIVDNRIVTGYGGAGGKGGAGGLGGFGGYGGKGGEGGNVEQTWCARAGRDGGNGGQGGFGGGGGGGCGGPAMGLYLSGAKVLDPSAFLEPSNEFGLDGGGGAGGPGGKLQFPGAPEGGKGADGLHKKSNL